MLQAIDLARTCFTCFVSVEPVECFIRVVLDVLRLNLRLPVADGPGSINLGGIVPLGNSPISA